MNSTYARRVLGQTNPVGSFVKIDDSQRLVIGVSPDVLQGQLEKAATPLVYFPIAQ